MTQITNGQSVSGTFDGAVHGVAIHSYTFLATANDNIILRASARGYNPAQLRIDVAGPAPSIDHVASAVGRVQVHVQKTGIYTVTLYHQ